MMIRRSVSDRLVIAAALGLGLGGCTWNFPIRSLADAAERDTGKTAQQMGTPAQLWCADAVNKWRRKAGMKTVSSRRAIDQAKAGKRINYPIRGALMITPRGNGGNHVDVVLEVLPENMVRVVGGNVGGAVSQRIVPARGLFVLPV